jgi:hypothetical protein
MLTAARARSDKKLMEDTETAGDPRAKVSMKKIFGGPNTKKDGTQGKARRSPRRRPPARV